MKKFLILLAAVIVITLTAFTSSRNTKPLIQCEKYTELESSAAAAEAKAATWKQAHKTAIIVDAEETVHQHVPGAGDFYYTVVTYTAAHCID